MTCHWPRSVCLCLAAVGCLRPQCWRSVIISSSPTWLLGTERWDALDFWFTFSNVLAWLATYLPSGHVEPNPGSFERVQQPCHCLSIIPPTACHHFTHAHLTTSFATRPSDFALSPISRMTTLYRTWGHLSVNNCWHSALGPFSEESLSYEMGKAWHWLKCGDFSTPLSLRKEPHIGNIPCTARGRARLAGSWVLSAPSSDSSSNFLALLPLLQILIQIKEVLLRWREGKSWSCPCMVPSPACTEVPKIPSEHAG